MNYQQVKVCLADLKEFKHAHSMRAAYEGGDYVVYSYWTEIARVKPDGAIILNPNKYSVTTSRQQGMLYLLGTGN